MGKNIKYMYHPGHIPQGKMINLWSLSTFWQKNNFLPVKNSHYDKIIVIEKNYHGFIVCRDTKASVSIK